MTYQECQKHCQHNEKTSHGLGEYLKYILHNWVVCRTHKELWKFNVSEKAKEMVIIWPNSLLVMYSKHVHTKSIHECL